MPMCLNLKIWTKVLQLNAKQTSSLAPLRQQHGTQTQTPEMLPEILKLAEYIQNSAPATSTAPELPWDSLGAGQKPKQRDETFENASQGSYSGPSTASASWLPNNVPAVKVFFRENPNPMSLLLPPNH